jgi:hypothetical protein
MRETVNNTASLPLGLICIVTFNLIITCYFFILIENVFRYIYMQECYFVSSFEFRVTSFEFRVSVGNVRVSS